MSTSELSRRFGVSTVTIRQDLAALRAQGVAERTFGGATSAPRAIADSPFEQRAHEHAAAKRRIGAAAAALVRPGETILLDAGTTVLEVVRNLPADTELTVVTGALNLALEAATRPGVQVIVCGGRLNPRTLATVGAGLDDQLAELQADRLFLGTYGVDLARGLVERSYEVALSKRALIAAAREVVLVCDSSKFGATGPILISPMAMVHRVVTDTGLPAAARDTLLAAGIAVDLV